MKRPLLFLLLLLPLVSSAQTRLDTLKQQFRSSRIDSVRLRLKYQIEAEKQNYTVGVYDSLYTEAKKLKLRRLEGECLAMIGSIERNTGNINKATECYIGYMNIMKELGDKKGIATAKNGLASIYRALNDTAKAIEYLNEAYSIAESVGYKTEMSASLNSLAIIERSKGHTAQAIDYYKRSLAIRLEIKDKFGIAESYLNLGNLYRADGDMASARTNLEKSYELFKEIKDKQGMNYALNHLANVSLAEKNYADAERYSKMALELGNETGFPRMLRNAAQTLVKIYTATGRYKEALDMNLLYYRMRDSINNQDLREASLKASLKFDFQQKAAADSVRVAKEKEVTAAQLKQEETQRYALYSGLALTLVFGGFMFNRFRVTRKQNRIIEQQKKEVDEKNHIIEEKQKEIIDSINYAKRIQYTLLAHESLLKENLPEHFVLFQPKDIVSGDFYWATRKGDLFYLAVCDCTGHGVPGAFMSLLNIGFLGEAINEKGIEKPNEVFGFIRKRLVENISKEGQRDGFDGILVCFDTRNRRLTYAAANNAPLLVSNKTLKGLDYDRMPVGIGERQDEFRLYTAEMKPGDMLYLCTDGIADQFGGPKGKKFKYKQLEELLLSNCGAAPKAQAEKLRGAFESWKGNLEQVDDVLVMGIRING